MSILRRAINLIIPSQATSNNPQKDLIRMESKIGGTLFGPVPKDHRREFFCLDEHTWVWYESTIDPSTGKTTTLTTRYEIRGNRIIKAQDGQPYHYTSLEETRNLVAAMTQYYELIQQRIYAPVLSS